ncbi:MAG: sensor histidine kinase [Actinomycetota bacterium]
MLRDGVRSLWAEPRAPGPPARVWRDWALVAVAVAVMVLEGVLVQDLVWRLGSVAVGLALLPALLWRRSHPLAAAVFAFGLIGVVDLASLLAGVAWQGLSAYVVVLLLPYALFRWGAGREIVIGAAVMAVPTLLSGFDEPADFPIHAQIGDVAAENIVLGALVLLTAGAVGAAVRYADKDRRRGMDQVKLLEREQLARELHDTVAHHVSAIVIRAQAGRVVAPTDPDAALDALAVIEQEASRTLAEMRAMVGALRHGEEADLAPQRGVVDIEGLATDAGDRPHVEVHLVGDLERLPPSVDAAIYRLAQEAVTNAARHARNATCVTVAVYGEDDFVRLTVRDDGDPASFDPRSPSGFGLVGMAERAKLLGGTLDAGPDRERGWTVAAVLPRGGRP